MSSINKLSVRGVRSFSPEDAEQVLEFYTPLTVIVGENGCGKTTIIESLKFAVCGSLPPGKTAGQAFVHDPRSIGSSVVKANLKLRFTNGAGKPMVIVRSMEVTQKKTTMSFKQLDGVLRATDRTGNRVSMSHKCTELDRQIPLLLGVSKAILENVVFCHQEDASWPLQEGIVLKKKFDDIFDSTRYSKALEIFAKAKKEYVLKTKDHKADVAELRSHRHAAQGFRREVQEHTELLEQLEDQLASGRQALEENAVEQQKVEDLLEETAAADERLDSKQRDMLSERRDLITKRDAMTEDLTDRFDEAELTEQLSTFDSQKESHEEKKRDLDEKKRACEQELASIQKEQKDLQSEVGRLQAGKETHQDNLRKRYEKMCEVGQAYGLEAMLTPFSQNSQLGSATSGRLSSTQDTIYSRHPTQGDESPGKGAKEHGEGDVILDIPQEDIKQYFRAVENKKEELQDQLSTQKSKIREQEDELNNDLSDLKAKVKSIENKKKDLYAEESKTRAELDRIRRNQRGQKYRKGNLEDAKKKAIEAAKARDEANADPRKKDIPIEIKSIQNKIEDLKAKIQNDTELQQDLRRTFETQSAIEQLKGQCRTELEELQEKIADQRYQFQAYKISTPPSDLPGDDVDSTGEELKKVMESLSDEITNAFDDKERELTKHRDTMHRHEAIVSEKSALYNHDMQSIRSKKQRMDALKSSIDKTREVVRQVRSFEERNDEDPIPNHITENNPEELLAHLTKRVESIQGRSIEGISPEMIKAILKKIFYLSKNSDNPDKNLCCPCCDRRLNNEAEVKRFQKTMRNLSGANSVLIQVDEETKVAEAKYNEWQGIVKNTVNDILEHGRLRKDLEELERSANTLDSTLRNRKNEAAKVKEHIESMENEVKDCRELSDASKIWVEASLRIALQRNQVSQKESDFRMMNSDREGRDLKQVENDLLESNRKKDDYNDKVTKLNTEITTINDRIQHFSTVATRTENDLKQMESKYEEQLKLDERQKEFSKKFADGKQEQDKLSEQIAPLNQRIEAKESQKSRARRLSEEEEKRIFSTLTAFNNDVTALQNVVDSIEEYEKSNSQDQVQSMATKTKGLIEKEKKKKKEIDTMEPYLMRLGKIVDDQEKQRKNLESNIKVIQSQQKIKKFEKELTEIEKDSRCVEDRESLEEEKERLRKRNDELIARKARLEGKRGVIIDTVRGLKRKLSQSEYKDVEEAFRIASIKQDTTELAVKDIDKYHSALDRALQRYHSLKITQINTIIRDLWTLTYKGEDIRNIEIVSGKDAGGRSSRSYNYRVVMSKGSGTTMDMRGRCSAGQRVLASIVIRLALAETFCVKFGCISLDEPTVNLDYKNKRGLAVALAQIIASRSQQSNFQLVLITHDEEFVLMMKSELSSQSNVSMPEKYFQIRREEGMDGKFYSKVDAIDWEELL